MFSILMASKIVCNLPIASLIFIKFFNVALPLDIENIVCPLILVLFLPGLLHAII